MWPDAMRKVSRPRSLLLLVTMNNSGLIFPSLHSFSPYVFHYWKCPAYTISEYRTIPSISLLEISISHLLSAWSVCYVCIFGPAQPGQWHPWPRPKPGPAYFEKKIRPSSTRWLREWFQQLESVRCNIGLFLLLRLQLSDCCQVS